MVNDVLMQGKKLNGTLTEAVIEGESGTVSSLIVGIGINLRPNPAWPEEVRRVAGAISDFGPVPRRAALIASVLTHFEQAYSLVEQGREGELVALYRERLCCIGRKITVVSENTRPSASVWTARDICSSAPPTAPRPRSRPARSVFVYKNHHSKEISDMFQTAAGVTVPYPEKLNEQYLRDGNTITANLSFEKLSDFIHAFYAELDEPLFLAVHPDAEADEVWYLDGMTKKQLTMILDGYGELLCCDGLVMFAIGSLTTRGGAFRAEWCLIYSETVERFEPLLRQFDVEKTPNLVTAWDTFSEAHPGSAERLEVAGQTIPDMIRELCRIGMYKG